MSLHQLATQMAAHGRGPDDQLVHMSGNEVAGLQAIAKAHGGSLTINPHTGLAEAGFLDKLMPMIVGAGLMYATGGAAGAAMPGLMGMSMPATIGAGVGALETARTGSLGKGIMAGMGAYGGAGMLGAAGQAGMLSGAEANSALTTPNVPSLAQAGSASSGAPGMDSFIGGNGMTNTSQAMLPDAIDMGGGFNPATGSAASPVHAAPPSIGDLVMQNKAYAGAAAAPAIMDAMQPKTSTPEGKDQMIRPYTFEYNKQTPTNMIGATRQDNQDTSERTWFNPQYTALTPYKAAAGGLMALEGGGPVERMSNANAIGQNTGFPMADLHQGAYATPYQTPISQNVVQGAADTGVNPMTGEQNFAAGGGISTLGGYSDGGRLLKGPGDGMSDNIPASIGAKQPARLADGEFVVPADVVSHLGNGSTDAGAKQLYKMMDRIRTQRTGKKKQAPEVNPNKAMPA